MQLRRGACYLYKWKASLTGNSNAKIVQRLTGPAPYKCTRHLWPFTVFDNDELDAFPSEFCAASSLEIIYINYIESRENVASHDGLSNETNHFKFQNQNRRIACVRYLVKTVWPYLLQTFHECGTKWSAR